MNVQNVNFFNKSESTFKRLDGEIPGILLNLGTILIGPLGDELDTYALRLYEKQSSNLNDLELVVLKVRTKWNSILPSPNQVDSEILFHEFMSQMLAMTTIDKVINGVTQLELLDEGTHPSRMYTPCPSITLSFSDKEESFSEVKKLIEAREDLHMLKGLSEEDWEYLKDTRLSLT